MTSTFDGIVVIPTWRRPDLLKETCRRLKAARGSSNYWYNFHVDRGYDPQVVEVARQSGLNGNIFIAEKHTHKGNSYNVISGLFQAYRTLKKARAYDCMVYLVEEDIHVSDDFFDWHETVHDEPEILIASAVKDQNTDMQFSPAPDLWYRRRKYQSLGVSFEQEFLEELELYVPDLYWTDPVAMMRRMFPGSKMAPHAFTEQDGLIDRVIEKLEMDVAYPTLPRAYHAGVVGYHDGIVHTITPCPDSIPYQEEIFEIPGPDYYQR